MGRLRGFLWLTTGLFVSALAGFVGFVTLSQAQLQAVAGSVAQPEVSVVVAASAIGTRSVLGADNLEVKQMPVGAVPDGAVREIDAAVGRLTLVDLYQGEVVLAQRLVEPNVTAANGRMALVVAEDKVLMAFPAQDLMSRAGVLKAGDRVDLLFSIEMEAEEESETGDLMEAEKEKITFSVLQNVTVEAAVVGTSGGSGDGSTTQGSATGAGTLLLTVSPQDALVLKHVKDFGGIVDVVLRAPEADQPFEAAPVDAEYLIDRYQLPVERRP